MVLNYLKLLKMVKIYPFKRFKSTITNDIRNIGILAHIDAGKPAFFVFDTKFS